MMFTHTAVFSNCLRYRADGGNRETTEFRLCGFMKEGFYGCVPIR